MRGRLEGFFHDKESLSAGRNELKFIVTVWETVAPLNFIYPFIYQSCLYGLYLGYYGSDIDETWNLGPIGYIKFFVKIGLLVMSL